MDNWRIELLGGARLRGGRSEARPLERKTAALLAYLALEGETARPILAGLLWPDSREATARNNLSQVLRRLRELLGEPVVEGRETLRLGDTPPVDLQALLRGEPPGVGSPGGQLLAGLGYDDCEALEDWLAGARPRVLVLQQRALVARVLLEEREGRLPAALEVAQQLLQLEPTSEEAFQHLMRLHHRLGNRSLVLKSWRQYGSNVTGPLAVPTTGAWQTYTTVRKDDLVLTQGPHVLRFVIDTSGSSTLLGNVNWFRFTRTSTYLSDLSWTSALNGYGPAEKDQSNGEKLAGDGRTLTLNGVTYAKGLGVHAASELVYALDGSAQSLVSDIGVDDEVGTQGSVVFQVFADGALLDGLEGHPGARRGGKRAVRGVHRDHRGSRAGALGVQPRHGPAPAQGTHRWPVGSHGSGRPGGHARRRL